MNFKIRKALLGDSDFLFQLRNEESVRLVSLHGDPISLEVHQRWFANKLGNSNSVIFIAETDGVPIAQTRFDVIGNDAEVSIAVVKEYRGKGYGSEILRKTSRECFEMFPDLKVINAFINFGNDNSARSFSKAGYSYDRISENGGLTRRVMVIKR